MPIAHPRHRAGATLRLCLPALALVFVCGGALAQQDIGEALFVTGASTAQAPGAAPRFLAKGDRLVEGDLINTGSKGFAVIGLQDGTKMTLRPNTAFAIDRFSQAPGQENLLMRLVRGGLRAITGAIGKRNTDAVRIHTATATIGIRGTEFDARQCAADCRDEAQRQRVAVPPKGVAVAVARVVAVNGSAQAIGSDGETRPLSPGASLYNGDVVRTASASNAVMAFRDGSKITVIEKSESKLENVRFASSQADSGNFVIRIARGGLRALTGLLAKRDPASVRFETATATIGIRGTGADIRLAEHCVDAPAAPAAPAPRKKKAAAKAPPPPPPAKVCSDSAFAYTWDGAVVLIAGGVEQLVEKDKAAVFSPRRGKPELLAAVPDFFVGETAPRPDTVEIDLQQLFGTRQFDDFPDGLYVGVRKGHVVVSGADGKTDLGVWESAVLPDGSRAPSRLAENPGFLFNDPYPTPDEADDRTFRLLELLNPGGGPGVGICELYK